MPGLALLEAAVEGPEALSRALGGAEVAEVGGRRRGRAQVWRWRAGGRARLVADAASLRRAS